MNADDRQPLEEKAERVKQRLLDNVDRLEERTEAVVSSVRKAKASVSTVVMGAAVATALFGAAWFVMRRRKVRSRGVQWSLPSRQRPKSLASHLARQLFFSGGPIVATHMLRWGLNRYVPIEGATAEKRWTES